jgi:crotonobetainyl-CoA:carnitine CoA-transferase CaiB-like acyl-CoA transferase
MTYATLRMVHQGWRVIRLEATPLPGRKSKGDPNRYVGRPVAGEDRHSYFIGPNVGKQALAIDLKRPEGQALLRRLILGLKVDVFCTNTMPANHRDLGIDGPSLMREKADLIWCCISALGLAHPEVPGYDPVLQALCGYMDLTGQADGPPLLSGIPLVDLKAGDEAFTQVLLALIERAETGRGRCIDISMAQVAVSWLQTFLPMLDLGSDPSELRRSGNEHRQFIPVNAYRTRDGYIYLAIGSDAQWARFVARPMFSPLSQPDRATNEGRRRDRVALHQAIEGITRGHSSDEVAGELATAQIPHSEITPIEQVSGLPFVSGSLLSTRTPDGRTVRLPPPAVPTAHLETLGGALPFAPAFGQDTDALLGEAGLSAAEIASLRDQGVVA